ncbi:unnamed protein product [marine sediment metagenome]|uniref:Uncharacterized protein n=1 Tax=marine sediment metagenome TaxID=412755 RepID=X0ZTQ0_9ZZZZ
MLDVEMLVCKNPQFHKDCQWKHAGIRYPDERYLPLKQRLTSEVKKTHIAYRITHWKFGVLTTIKLGHDNKIFVVDNQQALKDFALY